MDDKQVTEFRTARGMTALVSRKRAIKKALTYHLSGIGESRGLLYKALETANKWLDGRDPELQAKAVDIVIKLLPYVIEKEGQVTGGSIGPNGTGVINVQINNFDSFIKDRLSQTNLGKLLSGHDLQQSSNVDSHNIIIENRQLTPPTTPGTTPGLSEDSVLPNDAHPSD